MLNRPLFTTELLCLALAIAACRDTTASAAPAASPTTSPSPSTTADLDAWCASLAPDDVLKRDPALQRALQNPDLGAVMAVQRLLGSKGYDGLRAEAERRGVETWSCAHRETPARSLPSLPGPMVRLTPRVIRVDGDAAPLAEDNLDATLAARPDLARGYSLDVRTDTDTARVTALLESTSKAGIARVNLVLAGQGHTYALRIQPWTGPVDCSGKALPFRLLATTNDPPRPLVVAWTRSDGVLLGATDAVLDTGGPHPGRTFPAGTTAEREAIQRKLDTIQLVYPQFVTSFAGDAGVPFRRTVFWKTLEDPRTSDRLALAAPACPDRDPSKVSGFVFVAAPEPAALERR